MFTRRGFIKAAMGTGISALLAPMYLTAAIPPQREKRLPEIINPTLIFFGETHTQSSHKNVLLQRIENELRPSVIGLEGIAGAIDSARIVAQRREIERYMASQRIDFRNLRTSFTPSSDDSSHIRLQKLRGTLQQAIADDYVSSASLKGNPYFDDFLRSIITLDRLLPGRQPSQPTIEEYYVKKAFPQAVPRIDAPGLNYLALSTSARKTGIEDTELDRYASRIIDAMFLWKMIEQRTYHMITIGAAACALEDSLSEKTRDTLSQYLGCWDTVGTEMNDHADHLMTGYPDLVKESARTGDLDHPMIQDIVIEQRSEAWVRNMKRYDLPLIIGGARHRDSIASAAATQGYQVLEIILG